jgi:hypothetical protein
MFPRQYTVQVNGKPEYKTEFIRIGSAFPLKERDGFSLDIGVPITLTEGKLLMFVREERDDAAPAPSRNNGNGGRR